MEVFLKLDSLQTSLPVGGKSSPNLTYLECRGGQGKRDVKADIPIVQNVPYLQDIPRILIYYNQTPGIFIQNEDITHNSKPPP
jgi:hypothetical protein